MDQHTPVIKLVHPNRTAKTRIIDAFVDDTNSGLKIESLEAFTPPSQSPVPKFSTIYS